MCLDDKMDSFCCIFIEREHSAHRQTTQMVNRSCLTGVFALSVADTIKLYMGPFNFVCSPHMRCRITILDF